MLNIFLGIYLFVAIFSLALIWASLIGAKEYDQEKGYDRE